jgi:hypothetical protein
LTGHSRLKKVHSNQGDQMSLCCPTHFLSKLMHKT